MLYDRWYSFAGFDTPIPSISNLLFCTLLFFHLNSARTHIPLEKIRPSLVYVYKSIPNNKNNKLLYFYSNFVVFSHNHLFLKFIWYSLNFFYNTILNEILKRIRNPLYSYQIFCFTYFVQKYRKPLLNSFCL